MKVITLVYKKIITAQSEGAWEKRVFADSYSEFCMQGQLFTNKGVCLSFSQMQQAQPQSSQLHHLVSASVIAYLHQLKNVIPDKCDSLGQLFLSFDQYRFEIIESHLQDRTQHQIALTFFSHPMVWHDTIGERLLLSDAWRDREANGYNLHLFSLGNDTGIYTLQTDQEK